MSKLGLAAVAALLVLGIAASTASAQAPTVIEAVDSPGPAFQPSEVTVATGTTVRWEFDQATAQHTVTSTGDELGPAPRRDAQPRRRAPSSAPSIPPGRTRTSAGSTAA